jgi:antitoxin MazE
MYIHVVYTIIKGVGKMQEATTVSQWGNSKGIRMPAEILRKAQIHLNDKIFFEVDENKRVILTKTPTPKQGTLEHLFKNYSGGSFQAELIELGEAVGGERW